MIDIQCFKTIYSKYIRSSSRNDVFTIDDVNMLRGEYKDMGNKQVLKNNPKMMDSFRHMEIANPFSTGIYEGYEKTAVQTTIEKIANIMPYIGSIAFSCSCGSGKTLAGLLLASIVGKQTLIISARSAVNDQWKSVIEKIYPECYIETIDGQFVNKEKIKNKKRVGSDRISFFIYSPQYLYKDLKLFPPVGLIIYDEIHSLLSKEFAKVLVQPMEMVNRKIISELPYTIALSATYPTEGSDGANIIGKIFGSINICNSSIIDIPIHVYDVRKHTEGRGVLDKRYLPLDDYQFLDSLSDSDYYTHEIEPSIANNKSCGYIITSTIDSSIYAWLTFYRKYKCRCILIRDNNEGCYVLTSDIPEDVTRYDVTITYDILKEYEDKFYTKCASYENADIVFGTYHRLKEGVSIENATWGICTKFVWSLSSRIQILGRIRRYSVDDFIKNSKRVFMVNSGKIPTNINEMYTKRKYKSKAKFELKALYDEELEAKIFSRENYIFV